MSTFAAKAAAVSLAFSALTTATRAEAAAPVPEKAPANPDLVVENPGVPQSKHDKRRAQSDAVVALDRDLEAKFKSKDPADIKKGYELLAAATPAQLAKLANSLSDASKQRILSNDALTPEQQKAYAAKVFTAADLKATETFLANLAKAAGAESVTGKTLADLRTGIQEHTRAARMLIELGVYKPADTTVKALLDTVIGKLPAPGSTPAEQRAGKEATGHGNWLKMVFGQV